MFSSSNAFASAKTRLWDPLSARDRNSLALLAVVILTTFLWTMVWQPAQSYYDASKKRYDESIRTQAGMARSGNQAYTPRGLAQSLSAVLTQTAGEQQITINTLTFASDGSAQLYSSKAPFNSVMKWLHAMEKDHGATVDELELIKTEEGMVSVTAKISSPAIQNQ